MNSQFVTRNYVTIWKYNITFKISIFSIFVISNYIKMGLLFTTPTLEILETYLNNILMINNEVEIIEDTVFDVEDFYIIESNL